MKSLTLSVTLLVGAAVTSLHVPGPRIACASFLADDVDLLKVSPAEFIKRHDKDHDNKLAQHEVPDMFAQAFTKADLNKDGMLDEPEVGVMLLTMRQMLDNPPRTDQHPRTSTTLR